jgi:hypothetical protein
MPRVMLLLHLLNTTGGDMDIDTLSVLTKTIDANGRAYSFAAFITDETGFSILNMKAAYKKKSQMQKRGVSKLIECILINR